jgi:hypothetical protein
VSELNYRTDLGHLHVQGWRKGMMEAASELGLEIARRNERAARALEIGGERVWLKGGPIAGRARVRHGLRHVVLRRRAPRIQEYFNLSWMIERHFQCALPHAAGVFTRHGLPHYQYLLTGEIGGARTLLDVLEQGSAIARAPLLAELAREISRLHALGFVHHDLFLRNVLVAPRENARSLWLVDAWRGGPRPQLRGPAYDLACLFLDAAALLDPAEQQRFLEAYLEGRAAQGRPAQASALFPAIARARRALYAQLVADPGRRRGRELPPPSWDPGLLRADAPARS